MHSITITQGRLHLAARIAGDPSKPGLMLLHGWPQSGRIFERVIDRLGADNFVIAFDLPGIGESRGLPPSAEKVALAGILLSAAEGAGCRRTIVAGIDVGGMIAYATAHAYGARVAGAVIIDAALPGLHPWQKLMADPANWHMAFHALPGMAEKLVQGRERAYFDHFFDALAGRRPLSEMYREAFTAAYARPEALTAGFEWFRAMQADAAANILRRRLMTPLLYLRSDAAGVGTEDFVAGLKTMNAENVINGVIRDSGLFSPLEAPDQLIHYLQTFRTRCDTLRRAA